MNMQYLVLHSSMHVHVLSYIVWSYNKVSDNTECCVSVKHVLLVIRSAVRFFTIPYKISTAQ